MPHRRQPEIGNKLHLGCGRAASLCFQLESECLAIAEQDQIRNSGANAQAGKDRGFYWIAAAPVRNVKPDETGCASLVKVLTHRPLDDLFGRCATVRRFPSARRAEAAHGCASLASVSSATPSGPVAFPRVSRQSALRRVSMGQPN
jgi:hypothetical protein